MHKCVFVFLLLFSLSACHHKQPDMTLKNNGVLDTYQLASNWLQLPGGFIMGSPTGLGIDSSGHLFIFCRAGREWTELVPMPAGTISGKTILEVDGKTGTLINSWGDHLFIMPHGLTIDKEDNIWVTDAGLQQVFKFSHNGKLLLTLGEARVPGNDHTHFNMPTAVAIAKDGGIYVSDGYGNSRVVKFSAAGKYLFEWGRSGDGAAEFNIPHAIDLDDNDNVYVADRENHRIQVFDSSGIFLKILENKNWGNLCSVVFDRQQKRLIAVDDRIELGITHKGSDIIVLDTADKAFTSFGRSGAYTGPVCWYHDIAVDKEGNIFVGDILGNRVQKFSKNAVHH